MSLNMRQFVTTQNQKQVQARTYKISTMPCEHAREIERAQSDKSFYYNENDRDISRFPD